MTRSTLTSASPSRPGSLLHTLSTRFSSPTRSNGHAQLLIQMGTFPSCDVLSQSSFLTTAFSARQGQQVQVLEVCCSAIHNLKSLRSTFPVTAITFTIESPLQTPIRPLAGSHDPSILLRCIRLTMTLLQEVALLLALVPRPVVVVATLPLRCLLVDSCLSLLIRNFFCPLVPSVPTLTTHRLIQRLLILVRPVDL